MLTAVIKDPWFVKKAGELFIGATAEEAMRCAVTAMPERGLAIPTILVAENARTHVKSAEWACRIIDNPRIGSRY